MELRIKLIDAIVERTRTDFGCVFEYEDNEKSKHAYRSFVRVVAYNDEAKVSSVLKYSSGDETTLYEDDIELLSVDELYEIYVKMPSELECLCRCESRHKYH